jgi:hypothetical protein
MFRHARKDGAAPQAKLAEVSKTVSEAKKIVKLDMPKDRWKEFGISDKA